MRAFEILTEAKVGRPLQHLEDLVFIDGAAGAKEALDYLEHMAQKATGNEYSIKWDGIPAIYWGRDKRGRFTLTGKNYWGKGEAGHPKSADELYSMIVGAGKQEAWRSELGASLRDMWAVAEQGTPASFRGYLFGDLLFSSPPKGDDLVFTPNKVTYTVPRDQELGQMLSKAQCAVAAHHWSSEFGSQESQKIPGLQKFETSNGTYWPTSSPRFAVLGPYFADTGVTIKASELSKLKAYLNKYATHIDGFLEGVSGLSNPPGEIYTFVNQQSKAQNLRNLEASFKHWVNEIGPKKRAAFEEKIRTNPKGLTALFYLVEKIMLLKNQVINQLDEQTPQVRSSVKGEPGGEGWVYKNVKLVPRDRWRPNL
jgi:hypothetical protein